MIPKSFTIRGLRFKVKFVPNVAVMAQKVGCPIKKDEEMWGYMSFSERTIFLHSEMDDELAEYVFWHECAHIIEEMMDLNGFKERDTDALGGLLRELAKTQEPKKRRRKNNDDLRGLSSGDSGRGSSNVRND